MKRFSDLNYYDLLQISVNASSFEIRQAYKSILSIYEENSLATYSLFAEEERETILARVEKAFLTLMDNEKRDAYDSRLINRGEISEDTIEKKERGKAIPIFQMNRAGTKGNSLSRIREKIREKGVQELSKTMIKGDAISGEDLKSLRESLGIELEEIFQATKISPTALRAIESDDLANLPPTVYLKSFLKIYAEVLQLDAKRIVDGYLRNAGIETD